MDAALSASLPGPPIGASTAFLALAARELGVAARPAFLHALRRAALIRGVPAWLAAAADEWPDELWALIQLVVQARCLSRLGACAEELAVGCGRSRPDGGVEPLTAHELTVSLCGAVVWPLARGKLESWGRSGVSLETPAGLDEDILRADSPVGDDAAAGLHAASSHTSLHDTVGRAWGRVAHGWTQFAPRACRALLALSSCADAAYILANAYGVSRYSSPWLHAAGLELVSPRRAAAPVPVASAAGKAAAVARGRSPAAIAWRALRAAAIAAVIALKLAQWMRAGRADRAAREAAEGLDAVGIPPPPPLPPIAAGVGPGVGAGGGSQRAAPPWARTTGSDASAAVAAGSVPCSSSGSICPTCGASPTRPTAAPSGHVYCAACIGAADACVVTGQPFSAAQLVRIYEL